MIPKDEGGKDNHILLHVKLQDRTTGAADASKLALKCTLLYESGERVQDQKLLQLHPRSDTRTDARGEAAVMVRIESVSANHQKQNFVILIGPDPNHCAHATVAAVDGVRSGPFTVKSKRSRQRPTGRKRRRAGI